MGPLHQLSSQPLSCNLPPPKTSLSLPKIHLGPVRAGHIDLLSRHLSPPNPYLGAGHIGPLSRSLNQFPPQPLSSSFLPLQTSLSPSNPHLGSLGAGHTGRLSRPTNRLNPQPLTLNLPLPQNSLFPLSPPLKPISAGGQGPLGSMGSLQLPLSTTSALHPLNLTPIPQGPAGEEQ